MREQVIVHRKGSSSAVNENDVIEAEAKVYLAEDIQRFLGLGRSKTYEYLQDVYKRQEPFRVIKIGRLFRIPKQSFDSWIYGEELM